MGETAILFLRVMLLRRVKGLKRWAILLRLEIERSSGGAKRKFYFYLKIRLLRSLLKQKSNLNRRSRTAKLLLKNFYLPAKDKSISSSKYFRST
jgi:hypothetical protein